jgi:hypothetical protein
MTRKLFVLLLTAALLLSACNLPVASGAGTHAWIDAPLDGMHLLVQPYSIVFHGSDPHGIARMEVSINGAVLATLPNPDTAKTLVYLTQAWQPQGPGRYIIRVRAQNTAGAWSEQDLVTVEVAGAATPTPTPVASLTPTPTLVASLTLTPTPSPSSTPSSTPSQVAAVFGQPVISTDVFQYRDDCLPNPDRVTIKVSLSNPAAGLIVYLYYRLRNISTDTLTGWNNGLNMTYMGGGTYQITVTSLSLSDARGLNGAAAEFQYQFIVMNGQGVPLRSPVYTNIKLSSCR